MTGLAAVLGLILAVLALLLPSAMPLRLRIKVAIALFIIPPLLLRILTGLLVTSEDARRPRRPSSELDPR